MMAGQDDSQTVQVQWISYDALCCFCLWRRSNVLMFMSRFILTLIPFAMAVQLHDYKNVCVCFFNSVLQL